ncbi:MAG: Ig-like domain-containing protein, partial [Planctomycetales bacterium]
GVLGNDTLIESGALTAERIDDVQHGTLQFSADGSFTYQPVDDFVGFDTFPSKVNDGLSDSDTLATVTLVVSNLLHTLDNPNSSYQGERFGNSVATDGNYVLVGAYYNQVFTTGYSDGQAYLFEAATGNLLHTFNPPEGVNSGWEKFGSSVAVDGNLALIGDPEQDVGTDSTELGAGQAYLYDATTGDLIHIIDDPAPTYNGGFASAVAIDGNHILVGNSNHFIPNSGGGNEPVGQAYLFDATTGDLLHTFDDPTNTQSDAFGVSVAIEGDRILIGASGGRSPLPLSGEAHLFDTTTGSLLHTFENPTPSVRDYFGNSVAIDGERILIGEFEDSTQGEDVGQAHLYDATSYSLIHTFNDPT